MAIVSTKQWTPRDLAFSDGHTDGSTRASTASMSTYRYPGFCGRSNSAVECNCAYCRSSAGETEHPLRALNTDSACSFLKRELDREQR